MWTQFPAISNETEKDDSLVVLDIPASVENRECFNWEHTKKPYDYKYFDLTLALGRMEHGFNHEYAEHYIADIGNMLQLYFKYSHFKKFQFQLFVTSYAPVKSKLATFSFKNNMQMSDNTTKNTFFERFFQYGQSLLSLWESECRKLFRYFNKIHPKFLIKPVTKSAFLGMSRRTSAFEEDKKQILMEYYTTGLIFVSDSKLLDDYDNALTIAHEIGHLFGLPHDEDNPYCTTTTDGLMEGEEFYGWRKPLDCNTKSILLDSYFTNKTITEYSNFYFEKLEQ
ncbi:hypothetical protein HMI54_007993 [Coelomomyces lativittatus]|nr:hypothetical protein HMI55_003175 [Coelomomyces lativittatus]KAJ1503531.1 hypothetical protein HMI54_007993 [Coelomomyces lativittatus]KAJ1509142.1 hypothetical protein HMI56_006938 [Coelomomyces lativittatus]